MDSRTFILLMESDNPQNLLVWSEDFTQGWSTLLTPTGTAHTFTDNNASGLEAVYQTIPLTVGAPHTFTAWVLKDAVSNRFPKLAIAEGANNYSVQINTQTGATAVSVSTGYASPAHVVVDEGTYWRLSLTAVILHATNTAFYVAAAAGTVFGTDAAAAQGTVTVDKTQLNRGVTPAPYVLTTSAPVP